MTCIRNFTVSSKRPALLKKKPGFAQKLFAETALDGVQSHSIYRLDFFLEYIKKGYVKIHKEPELIAAFDSLERWDGNLAPGNLNAWFSMDRAIKLAHRYGMGCVAIRNTNHWMRGGTYGWQAAGQELLCCLFYQHNSEYAPMGID